jgi:hypothetical protein
MEVIAVGKEMFATTARDLRSHHLRLLVDYWFDQVARRYALDVAIVSGCHTEMFTYPDHTLDSSLMGQAAGVLQEIWRGIGPIDVKDPDLLLLTAGEEMRRC